MQRPSLCNANRLLKFGRGVLVFMFALIGEANAVVDYHNANVSTLQATYQDTNCFYFRLIGVAQADPVVPGSPWFAVPRSQTGAGDVYALLLGAKLSGAPVWIQTSGQMVCGYAAVRQAFLE
jgi:hypothetical protein